MRPSRAYAVSEARPHGSCSRRCTVRAVAPREHRAAELFARVSRLPAAASDRFFAMCATFDRDDCRHAAARHFAFTKCPRRPHSRSRLGSRSRATSASPHSATRIRAFAPESSRRCARSASTSTRTTRRILIGSCKASSTSPWPAAERCSSSSSTIRRTTPCSPRPWTASGSRRASRAASTPTRIWHRIITASPSRTICSTRPRARSAGSRRRGSPSAAMGPSIA